jgi:SAM-dependent methyltransferase
MRDYQETYAVNLRRWDEAAPIHAASDFYGVERFKAGEDVLGPIESAEIGDIAGKRLVHLQCHFGLDTLSLARRGAVATGYDFSPTALAIARGLAAETGLAAEFVEGNLYDAPKRLPQGGFDIAYVTCGAINWLPDIAGWAKVVASLLAPGGFLYLLEGHPAANMLDQKRPEDPIVPTYDYFQGPEPLVFTETETYTEDGAKLRNRVMHEWIHSLASVIGGLLEAGLALEWLHEHDRLPWKLFPCMTRAADGMYDMPAGHPKLPLLFSLKAAKPPA